MALEIRRDIYEKHQSLFGDKTVNGKKVNVEELITKLTRENSDDFRSLLGVRHAFQDQVGRHERTYTFLPPDTKISDADGNTATVRDIRQGMLDAFFGRKTPQAWRLNPSVPIPKDTMRPGLEGTGPAIDLGMAMGALNTGAASWMWDWEDAGGDYKDQLYQAWENLRDLLAHKWVGKPFVHPSKKQGGKPREYTIDLPPDKWPTIFHRVPGLHLQNRQIALDGEQVPAMIPALVIHAVSNYDTQKKNGSGIYYYVPKIETWQEARLVAKLLKRRRRRPGTGARHAQDQDAERARRIRAAAGSHHVGAAREPHRTERRPVGLSEQPRRDVPSRPVDGDSRSQHRHDDRAHAELLHDAQRAPRVARRRHADRRHGGADAESAGARERSQGAPRHLVRQAARTADRAVQDQRPGARHLSPVLGCDHHAVVRRSGPRVARHRRQRSAGGRRQADARRAEAARGLSGC